MLENNPKYINKYKSIPITSLSMLITEDCNLACKYCYEKDKHTKTIMDKHVARKAIDFLIENTKKENADKNINLMLFGGEPTLNPTIISFVFEYVYKKQKEYKDINFSVSMITNCTNLPNEVYNAIDEFKNKIKISIQLSIDGIERVQNMNRITKSGGDSFAMVEKNVWKYKKLFKDNPDALSIHGVLSPASLPYLFESYKFFREEWNFSRIWFIPACDEMLWPKGISEEYDLVMKNIYEYILNIVKKENDINEIYNYAPLDRCLGNRPGFLKPCGAGVNYASVTTHGDLYPCHQIYFLDDKDETYIGNIFDGVDDDKRRLFLEYSPEDLTCPSDCDHYNCYRCIASNWEVNGSILSQIRGEYCEMMKIDQKYQKMLKDEVEKMGLLKSETTVGKANCECDMRECGDCLCNVDNRKQSKCQCDDETNTNEINYALMEGMKLLLEKVDKIEKKLEGKNETGNIRCTCYERM